jgi:diguanylate cyclase (GGDEF)-like protein
VVIGSVAVHSWYGEIRTRVETIHPAVLDWSAESVRHRLEQARVAIGQLARASAADASDTVRLERARELVSSSRTFSGVVFLDDQGNVRESTGAGVPFVSLLDGLATKSALQTDIANAMAAAQLRRELAAVDDVSIRLFALDGHRAAVMASAPLVDSRGRTRGSIHGLVRSAELSVALRSDLLGVGGIHLADEEGQIVAQAGDVMSFQGPLPPDALHASATPRLNVPWNADDEWTVRSARPVGVLGMAIVAEQPTLLAFKSMLLAAIQIAAAGGVLAAAFTLVASLMAVAFTRRLQALLNGIRAISNSDFAFRLPESGARDQLSLVDRGFNEMANHLMDLRGELDRSLEAVSKQNVGFRKRHDELAKLSITDGLTQLHNHRFFQDQLGREIKRLNRSSEGLCILIIDIDDFKKLNDTYGHAAGDEFLQQLARILKESVRETDVLARYGGEEFVIIAVGSTLDGARIFAEKLRTRIAETTFIVDKTMRPRGVTVTIGVAQYTHSRSELFTTADAALYRGKAAGKNCVVVAEPSTPA